MQGATVCRMHGGSAPQVRKAAELRLAALVDPAIGELARLMKKSRVDHVRLGAVKDVLDRAGYKPSDKVEFGTEGGKPLQINVRFDNPPPSE